MADLTFYDAAFPPDPAPPTDGVVIYVGGDAVHVWTAEETGMQPARYRLPVFVRSNPRGIAGVASDVNAALTQLAAIKAPRGCLVAWDLETAADKTYIAGVYTGLAAHGYELIVYGSQSTVMGNDNPDGLYWGADWTSHEHLTRGDAITQWVSFSGYDLDVAESSLPFWDTQAKPVKPPVTRPPAVPSWQEKMMDALPGLAQGADDAHLPHWYIRRAQAIANAVFGASLTVDGIFGPATTAAVEAIQRDSGIPVSGHLDAATWEVLLAP